MKFFITLVFFVAVTSASYAQRIVKIEYDENFKPHAVAELYNDNEDALPATVQSYVISPIGKVQSISQQGSIYLECDLWPRFAEMPLRIETQWDIKKRDNLWWRIRENHRIRRLKRILLSGWQCDCCQARDSIILPPQEYWNQGIIKIIKS